MLNKPFQSPAASIEVLAVVALYRFTKASKKLEIELSKTDMASLSFS